ncbi:MAG: fused MFS/spermidine synthase [Vicinamibacterales bacterium]
MKAFLPSSLLLLSGFAALVYQVLWMRDLAVVFGSSAHAAAIDLAVFFGGIAAGAGLYGRLAPRVANPLRLYGLLELGVAVSALLFFILLDVYAWIYAPLYQRFADRAALLVLVKSTLAVGVLALPTMCMGATLPAMVQHMGGRSAWLYGINTIGGTAGAFAAGFYLPPTLGFRRSYLLAVAINVLVGLVAVAAGRQRASAAVAPEAPRIARRPRIGTAKAPALPGPLATVLAFASGALTIALEVAWLRMFAQVLDNSVYAFSAVVVVALIAFAVAALVVSRAPIPAAPPATIAWVLALAAVVIVFEGTLFVRFTDNLSQVQGADGWPAYVRSVFTMAALFAGVPGLVAGVVFPSLLRLVPSGAVAAASVGRLIAFNTAGAIAGSLAVSFLVLPWLGLWRTLAAIAASYAALAVWIVVRHAAAGGVRVVVMALALVTSAAAAANGELPRLYLDAARAERVLALWEGSHGTVAVTESRGGRVLRLNNSYSLGGTTDRIERERIQTLIPLLLHADPKDVFFLGLGTGITAGEAVRHPVERVVVSELVPEVVHASSRYFREWTQGLDADPRVEIRMEDGRHYLASSGRSFDVIISDLFVPWHAGTGMLYTREHFETVRARLRPGGLFAQWLPLFQLNQRDFEVIARTLVAVFPHVVVWRGDFYANRPIVALVGATRPVRLDAARIVSRARALAPEASETMVLAGLFPYYAGNIGAARAVLGSGALNTDQRPVIEYLSPVTQWRSRAEGGAPWFVATPLVRFFDRLRAAVPPNQDPYLSALSPGKRSYVEAGAFYYRAIVARVEGDDEEAERDLGRALERMPADVQVSGPFMALDPLLR